MSTCQHDALDWFSAIGPTFAAFAAVGATIWAGLVARRVSRDAIDFQRELSKPRLAVIERFNPTHESGGLAWLVELRNEGPTPTNIRRFEIFVDSKPIAHVPLQNPAEVWFGVLMGLGLRQFGRLSGNMMWPPASLPAGGAQPLLDVILTEPLDAITAARRRLGIEIDYETVWGERKTLVRPFGDS